MIFDDPSLIMVIAVLAVAAALLIWLSLTMASAEGAVSRVTRASLNNLILETQTDQEMSQFTRMKRIERIHKVQKLIADRYATSGSCMFFRISCNVLDGVLVMCIASLCGAPLWLELVCGVLFALIVTVDLAERRIPVQYAKQVKGRKMYGGQATVIPIKISGSGVMPLIFAFAIISLPDLIMGLFWPNSDAYSNYQTWFSQGTGPLGWLYILVLCLLIFAFSFFYAQIQFNPEDVSKSIQQNGGFIPGIRPGRPTADYLKKISNRITLFGAIFLSLVAFIPSLAFSFAGEQYVNVFSTTGILIVVSVALEFDKQLQSQLMMKNYKGFLK